MIPTKTFLALSAVWLVCGLVTGVQPAQSHASLVNGDGYRYGYGIVHGPGPYGYSTGESYPHGYGGYGSSLYAPGYGYPYASRYNPYYAGAYYSYYPYGYAVPYYGYY